MSVAVTAARKTARKAKGDGHLRRAEILEAAERIFVAEGYEGATIRKIADEVGVSSTALYMHFHDKACILHEICQNTLQVVLARNAEIAGRPLDPAARTRMILESYVRWGLEHPNAYHLVYCAPPVRPLAPLPNPMSRLSQQGYDVFASVVEEIAAQGRLRTGDAQTAAEALWMACHGVVALYTGRPRFPWSSPEELTRVTLDSLMNGLVVD